MPIDEIGAIEKLHATLCNDIDIDNIKVTIKASYHLSLSLVKHSVNSLE